MTNHEVEGLPIVVTIAPGETIMAYERVIDGEVRTFEASDTIHLRAADSRWNRATDRAVNGPHEVTALTRANDASPMFFLVWVKFNSDTEVYQVG